MSTETLTGWLSLALFALWGCAPDCAPGALGATGLYPSRLTPIGDFSVQAFFQRDGGTPGFTAELTLARDGSVLASERTPFTSERQTLSVTTHVATPGQVSLAASVYCGGLLASSREEMAEFFPVVVPTGVIDLSCFSLARFGEGFDCDGTVVGADHAVDPRYVLLSNRRVASVDGGQFRWGFTDGGLMREGSSGERQWVVFGEDEDWVATSDLALFADAWVVDARTGLLQVAQIDGLADAGAALHALFVAPADGGGIVATFMANDESTDLGRHVLQCQLEGTNGSWNAKSCTSLRAQVVGVDLAGARLLTTSPPTSNERLLQIRLLNSNLEIERELVVGHSIDFQWISDLQVQMGVFSNAWAAYQGSGGGVLAYRSGLGAEIVIPIGVEGVRSAVGLVWGRGDGGELRFSELDDASIIRSR